MSDEHDIERPRFARMYRSMSEKMESKEADYRREMLAGLEGRVVELGCGNGMNFRHYPPTVESVVAVDPEPTMRSYAEEEAAKVSIPIEIRAGRAQDIPLEDASFDAAVASLVLCSVPDQTGALAELMRVLRGGGELRFFEHVVSDHWFKSGLQRAADATFWPLVAGGCHSARDTEKVIAESGFVIESVRHFAYRSAVVLPKIDHIVGVARRS